VFKFISPALVVDVGPNINPRPGQVDPNELNPFFDSGVESIQDTSYHSPEVQAKRDKTKLQERWKYVLYGMKLYEKGSP